MSVPLVYISYIVSALFAFGIFVGLPKQGRFPRRGAFIVVMAVASAMLIYLLQLLFGAESRNITFCILAVLGLAAAIRVVTHPLPVYSALYFVFVVLATAAMLIQVGAEFLGAALVIVYAGAILVTYVFVIMLSQQSPEMKGRISAMLDYDRSAREPVWATLACFMLMAVLAGMIVEHPWKTVAQPLSAVATRNTVELGRLLMTDFAVSVELAAVLLMVALVGAVAIARKRLPQAADFSDHKAPGEAGKTVVPY
ncbi:MAG: NADH-quinone oxidoreductase subunit J [Planctomycetes bacterium]|nr:NADH-quinone oxidoreductase subunit J [Planctomycetota bacterium]